MDPNESIIQNLNGTDSAKLNQNSYNGFSTHFERMSFQVQTEMKQPPFTVTKKNTVHTGVFTRQPKNYDWINSTANSNSRCEEDQESFFDKSSWSLINEEISLDYDDKLQKLILEGQTLPCLHSDDFCKPTPKHPYTFVWFPEKKIV